MKKMLCACAALIMAFTTLNVLAATDITGTWAGEMKSPDGDNSFALTFTFKQEGAKLTGTVHGPDGDPLTLADGKVEGSKISFNVTYNGMIISHEGTISEGGDEIKLSSKSDQGPAGVLVLKRSEAAKPPPPS